MEALVLQFISVTGASLVLFNSTAISSAFDAAILVFALPQTYAMFVGPDTPSAGARMRADTSQSTDD